MTIDTVVFDLDNTLLNRRDAFLSYANRFIDRYVHITNEEEKRAIRINEIIRNRYNELIAIN